MAGVSSAHEHHNADICEQRFHYSVWPIFELFVRQTGE